MISSPAQAANVSIGDDSTLKVSYDDSSNQFSIVSQNPPCTVTGTLALSGTASTSMEQNPNYGTGPSIVVKDAQNETARIIVFPHTPFVVFRHTFGNATSQAQTLNKVPFLSFSPDLGEPLWRLRVRSYSGLGNATDTNPGDYEWLAVADPQTRAGVVMGFISQWRSTGVIVRSVDADKTKMTITARSEYGRLLLDPGHATESESFAIGVFPDVRLGLESYADQLVKTYRIKLHPQPSGYITWYSDDHGGSGDEKSLTELNAFVGANLKPYGMSFVEIDDGWQMGNSGNGPNKNFTQYNPHGSYPSGMKAMADKIKGLGLTPGIWFMPFAGSYKDPWFSDKQDLFAKDSSGRPFDTPWGGTSLDMTNPATQEYVRQEVAQMSHDWGYTFFKMDGFFTGAVDQECYVNTTYNDAGFGSGVLKDPHKTNIEALRMGIGVVRAAAGPDVFFLGCCVAQNMRSYGGSFGTLDAMRIGPDNNGSWGGWSGDSPVLGSRNYFLNGRVWYDDPDPCYVRATLTLNQARTSASWTAIAGLLYANSDWIPGLPPERVEIIKRTAAPHGKTARPVDFLQNDPARVWQVTDGKGEGRRDVVALYNFSDQPQTMNVAVRDLNLPDAQSYAAFDFWANAYLPDVTDTLTRTLPPTSCQIIALRPIGDHPFVISTSRHVTQGMIDLSGETWSPTTHILSGKSLVIAGDPYEIRMVKPAQYQGWSASKCAVADSSGATITASDANGCRATITSSKTGPVIWEILFTPGK